MQNKLDRMITLAAQKHSGQFDKAGVPYFLHCLQVMKFVQEYTNDEDILCIAVGHDLLEDTDLQYSNLLGYFGYRIADGIMALTKQEGISYSQYLDGIKLNPDAIIVKLSDLRHNSDITRLKGVTEKDFTRMAKYMSAYQELKQCLK